jgi:hypothetical protein
VRFHDPNRIKIGDTPCWKDAPGIVIPELHVVPDAGGGFDVKVLVPTEESRPGFYWIERHLGGSNDLLALAEMWNEDPELALAFWWGKDPPRRDTTRAQAEVKIVPIQRVKLDL